MSEDIVVYTAVTGGFNDTIHSSPAYPGVRYVLYSDSLTTAPKPWELHRPVWYHVHGSRRTARYHKCNSHLLFPDAEFTVWMDGSHQLIVDPHKLTALLGSDKDFASFSHPQRQCAYREMEACIQLRKDRPQIMKAQMQRYLADGYPHDNGLYETACVVRRTGEASKKINEAWWKEITIGSCRDQLSLDYAIWKNRMGSVCGGIPGCREKSEFFTFRPHR